MNRPLKLFLGVIVSLVLALTLLLIQGQNSRSPDRPQPPEADQAASIGASLSADTVPAGAANRSVSPASASVQATTTQTYQWIEDDTIKGGIRVVANQNGRETEFVGTHLLARLGDGTREEDVNAWLEQRELGTVLENRMGLLKIAPAVKSLEKFLKLKQALSEAPDSLIAYSEPDYLYRIMIKPNDPGLDEAGAWYYEDINAFSGWNIKRDASGILVVVMDTGIAYGSYEFTGNIWNDNGSVGYDFVNDDPDPEDDHGHGTAVAGIIGARADNDFGVSGIAWSVQLIPLKVLNAYGYGLSSDIASGLDWAIGKGADIVNLSLGSKSLSRVLEASVAAAADAGIALVCSAGNEGNDMESVPVYPASYDYSNIVQVAASTRNGSLASFSNYQKELIDILAPGEDVTVLGLNEDQTLFTTTSSGSSFSAPIVSGILALVISQFPDEPLTASIQRILDAGRYREPLDFASKRGTTVDLYRALTGYQPQAPTISWPENPVEFIVGEVSELKPLIAKDSAISSLEWRRDGEILIEARNPLLTFNPPYEQADAGSYTLAITTREGTVTSAPVIVRTGQKPPRISYLSSDVTATPGTRVTLWIEVEKSSGVTVDWYETGKPDPVTTNSFRLDVIASYDTSFYAHVKGPFGETYSDEVQLKLSLVDWLRDLKSPLTEEPVPIGSLIWGPHAVNPEYWNYEILEKDFPGFQVAESGLYFYTSDDSGKFILNRIDPEGNHMTSEPLLFNRTAPIAVMSGVVSFPTYFAFNKALDESLREIPNSGGAFRLYGADEYAGWYYQTILNLETGFISLRRTRDFQFYETLADNIVPSDQAYNTYGLVVGESAIVIGLSAKYVWEPGEGFHPGEVTGNVVEKDGILYEVHPADNGLYRVFAYNPSANQWESIGLKDSEFMRSLGYMDYGLWNRSIQVPSGRVMELHDGSDWIGVKSIASSGAGNLEPTLASTDLFFAIGKTIFPKPIYYSSDGLLWNTTGLFKEIDNQITTFGRELVLISGSTSFWFDGYWTRSVDMGFDLEGFRKSNSLARYGENFLMEADFNGTDYTIHSTDLLNWKRTNLPARFLPKEFGQLENGLWYVYYPAGEEVYVSNDRVFWSRDESVQIPVDPEHIQFSMGLISGNQFSEDGSTWITLPFTPLGVVETEQRIIFKTNEYLWNGSYLDKIDGGASQTRNPPFPYITNQVYGMVNDPVRIDVNWGGLPRNDVRKIEIKIGEKSVAEFERLPSSLSFYPESFSRQTINSLVHRIDGRIERYELGFYSFRFLHPLLINGLEDDTTVLHPFPWENGWKTIFENKIIESPDMYDWQIDALVNLPVDSVTAFAIIGESWYVAGVSAGSPDEEHFLSTNQGRSWTKQDSTYLRRSLSVVGGIAVINDPETSAYSMDGVNWHDFPTELDTNSFFHYEGGFLYYAGSFKKLMRLDPETGQATEWANSAIALGAGVYVQYDLAQSDRVGIYSLESREELARLNETWRIPRDIHWVSKAGNYLTIEGDGARYTGIVEAGLEMSEPLNISLDDHYQGDYPPVGPHGIYIGDIDLLEWDYTNKPITRLRFNVHNTFPLPLPEAGSLVASVEWIHPGTGENAGRYEKSFNLFLKDFSSESVYLEMDAPGFEQEDDWNVVLSISGNPESGIHGLYSTLVEGIPVAAPARINIKADGSGSVQFDRPGPFAAGATVTITPTPKEGYLFSHWRIPEWVGGKYLNLKIAKANDVEAIFLPPGIAAIDRWSKRLSPVESQWYSGSGPGYIFLSESGWAHSEKTSWIWTSAISDSLYNWSPDFGWTCTRTDWFPYHWSYRMQDWVVFE